MSGKPPQSTAKVVVACSHCGFKQLESPFAKSTFCRKCSEHYEIGKAAPKVEAPRTSFLDKIGEMLGRKKTRDIICFKCGTGQTISISAKSSLCPHCSAYLDLTDFKIKTAYNRTIETQGSVHIANGGDVTSAKIACGEAFVYGKLRGNLFCSGNAHINVKGKFHGSLDVRNLVVEKRADIEAVRPIKCKKAEISGRLSGKIISEGTVYITKKGWFEGVIEARGIDIEKGGVFLGELQISSARPEEEDAANAAYDQDEIIAAPIAVEPIIGEVIDSGLDDGPSGPVVPPTHRNRKRGGSDDDSQLNFGIG